MSLPLYEGGINSAPPQAFHLPATSPGYPPGSPQYQVLRTPRGMYVRERPNYASGPDHQRGPASPRHSPRKQHAALPSPRKLTRSRRQFPVTNLSPIEQAAEAIGSQIGDSNDSASGSSGRSSAEESSVGTASTRGSLMQYPATPNTTNSAYGSAHQYTPPHSASVGKFPRHTNVGYRPTPSPQRPSYPHQPLTPSSSPRKVLNKRRTSYSAFPSPSAHRSISQRNRRPSTSDRSDNSHERPTRPTTNRPTPTGFTPPRPLTPGGPQRYPHNKSPDPPVPILDKSKNAANRDSVASRGSSIMEPMSEVSAAACSIFARALQRSQEQWSTNSSAPAELSATPVPQDDSSEEEGKRVREPISRVPASLQLQSAASPEAATFSPYTDFPLEAPPKSPLRRLTPRTQDYGSASDRDEPSPSHLVVAPTPSIEQEISVRSPDAITGVGRAATSGFDSNIDAFSRTRSRSRGKSLSSQTRPTIAERRSSNASAKGSSRKASVIDLNGLPCLPELQGEVPHTLAIDTQLAATGMSNSRSHSVDHPIIEESARESSFILPSPPPIRQKQFAQGPAIRVIAVTEHQEYTPLTPYHPRDSCKPVLPNSSTNPDSRRSSTQSLLADWLPDWAKLFYSGRMSIISSGQRNSTAGSECVFKPSADHPAHKAALARNKTRLSALTMRSIVEHPRPQIPRHRTPSPTQPPHEWHRCENINRCIAHPENTIEHLIKLRNIQIMLFAAGFLLPPTWFCGAVLRLPPLPRAKGKVSGPELSRREKTMSYLQLDPIDLEKLQLDPLEKTLESARWWRVTNRIMCVTGAAILICVVILVVSAAGR